MLKTQHALQRKDLEVVQWKEQRVIGGLLTVYHSLLKTGVVNSIMHIDLGCSDVITAEKLTQRSRSQFWNMGSSPSKL